MAQTQSDKMEEYILTRPREARGKFDECGIWDAEWGMREARIP
jgi:hypothetical protein